MPAPLFASAIAGLGKTRADVNVSEFGELWPSHTKPGVGPIRSLWSGIPSAVNAASTWDTEYVREDFGQDAPRGEYVPEDFDPDAPPHPASAQIPSRAAAQKVVLATVRKATAPAPQGSFRNTGPGECYPSGGLASRYADPLTDVSPLTNWRKSSVLMSFGWPQRRHTRRTKVSPAYDFTYGAPGS